MPAVARALASSLLALGLVACESSAPESPPDLAPAPDNLQPTRPASKAVSPLFIGTAGFAASAGTAFPGAAWPQGLAKPGPDTTGSFGNIQFLHCSGYWYGDDTIQGFSQTHLHGTGEQDDAVLGFMPVALFDPGKTSMASYQSTFAKTSESAVPGKYAVTLDNGNILVELTASVHAGHHRYTYPTSAAAAHVVIDLDHHLLDNGVTNETVTVDPTTSTFAGSLLSVGQLSSGFGGSTIYFSAKASKPWTNALVWSGGAPVTGLSAQGTGVGVDLDFDITDHAPIEIQVGLSFVSVAEAAANLAAEMPTFAFDAEAAAAADAWTQATSVVTMQGGTAEQQTMMQAALYHLFLMPTIQSDVDGSYIGIDRQQAKADGFHYVSELSLWDTYRTHVPLLDLVAPDRALDQVQSLVAMSKAGGFFPRWPIGDGESARLVGASAEVVVADAYAKGVRGFDAEGAYQTLRAAALSPTVPAGGRGGRDEVEPYMQLGYVPSSVKSSVSITIEYGQDDAALAHLATALGHTDDAATLTTRLHGWQKLFDPATGLLWAKDETGAFSTPHDNSVATTNEFDEADAQQTVWGPIYDLATLQTLMGGKAALVANLETFFEKSKADYDTVDWTQPFSYGLQRKYYFAGNEPDLHAVYLFALSGRPDLLQKWLPWLEGEMYGVGADGLPGNDDAGTMSAWLVESLLGFYGIPGTDEYVIGAPVFPSATIAVPGGTFTIEATDVSSMNTYVQSVALNGQPLTTPLVHHADFVPGGSLSFQMGPRPSTWGQD